VIAAVLGSIGILAAAMFVCLRLLWRTGEPRVATLAALVGLLGLGAGALLLVYGNRPLAVDLPTATALGLVAVALLALLVARAFAATLEELELAEALHWGSMQGVRALTELAAGERREPGGRLAALLELGCDRFGLEVGIVSRIDGERWEVHALHAPEGTPPGGSALGLADTLCRHTAASERIVAVEHVSAAPWAQPAGGDPLGLEAYLGAAVAVGGARFGTLVFASRMPRAERFTASQKDLLALMAQWVGFELEREVAGAAPRLGGREAAVVTIFRIGA
jgi:GAF domain-containing protein